MKNNWNQQICEAMDLLADGNETQAQSALETCISGIRAIPDTSRNSDDFYFWGMCLFLLEEPEQALLKFEKSVKLNPDNEQALWQIVSILFYTQQSAKPALSILEQRLLKVNPENQEYKNALADIQSYLKHSPEESSAAQTSESIPIIKPSEN